MNSLAEAKSALKKPLVFGDAEQIKAVRHLKAYGEAKAAIEAGYIGECCGCAGTGKCPECDGSGIEVESAELSKMRTDYLEKLVKRAGEEPK